jgi:gliding motility-associated-like protein
MKNFLSKRTFNYSLLSMLFITFVGQAQMVNLGELSTLPDTEMGIVSDFLNTSTGSFLNDGDVYIYRNFQNDGSVDFLNIGRTRFVGNSVQTISGVSEMFFYNLLFSNTSSLEPFLLSGILTVENTVDYSSGIINNRDFGGAFQFAINSNYTGAGQLSHVNGEVIKAGNFSFTFPIGNQGFHRPTAISAPQDTQDVFKSTYFFESSDTSVTPHNLSVDIIDQIDTTEYWELDRSSATSEVFITLGWDINMTPSFITNARPELIHIVQWDVTQGIWVDLGGVADTTNNTVTTIAPVNDFSTFTLATILPNIELPDDLIVYNGLTPNGDGRNDFFFIDGINKYPDNTVQIFNRSGVEVFKANGYNETTTVFRGFSDGELTVNRSDQLPTGTYFYILEYQFPGTATVPAQSVKKEGFLYIATED